MSENKSTEETIEDIKDAVEDAVDKAQDIAEDVIDDVQEAVEDAVDAVKPPLMALKDEKPAVFYGGIAAVVVVLGFFMFSGDDSSTKQHAQSAISLNQSYTLKAPNAAGNENATLKMLKIPGSMASFDNPDDVICHAPVGTAVIARGFQDAFGTKQLFVQVEIKQAIGDCREGVKGWTLKNNLK